MGSYANFYHVACQLGDLFTLLPEVEVVALSGSVARQEPDPHDIDLLVLHNGLMPNFCACFHSRTPDATTWNGERLLHIHLKRRAEPILRYLRTLGDIPLDLFFVDYRVLDSCQLLRRLCQAGHTQDPDFYRTIFCEIPLLAYDVFNTEFNIPIGHGVVRGCCKPSRTWKEIKRNLVMRSVDAPGSYMRRY